jgi:MFS family permease
MLVSLIGTWIQAVAQSWLVFQLTNSAFLLGVVGFLSSVPVFVLSLFGGVLADRVNKRNILIFTQTAFMLLAFVLAVLTYLKLITTGQIMFIAVLNGVVMAFDAPSRQSVVVELVGKKHLSNAIALSSVAFNSSRIIGPAIAGLLVSYIGMSGCFFVNGISFFAVIIALLLIKIDNGKVPNKNKKAWHDLIEGVVFIKNNRLLLLLIMIVGVMSLFGVSYVILMPIFANQVLNVGVRGLGVLMSGVGFGALIGALMLARLGDFQHKGKFLVGSIFIFSFSLVVFSLSRNYIFSIIVLSFLGGSSVTAMALINTLLQTRVNDELRGRVMSMFMLTFAGIMPFGNLIAGSLSQIIGVSSAVLVSGIVCTAMFAIINFFYPDIRKI